MERFVQEDLDVDWLKKDSYETKLVDEKAPDEILEFFDILKHAAIVNRSNEGATDFLALCLMHITGLSKRPFVAR